MTNRLVVPDIERRRQEDTACRADALERTAETQPGGSSDRHTPTAMIRPPVSTRADTRRANCSTGEMVCGWYKTSPYVARHRSS